MAEFCLECWNRLNHSDYTERDYILSEDLDLCEGCASFKPVVLYWRSFLSAILFDVQNLFHLKKDLPQETEPETVWDHFTEITDENPTEIIKKEQE